MISLEQKAEIVNEVFQNMGHDLLEPMGYLPIGVISVIIFLVVFEIANLLFFLGKTGKNLCYKKKWILFICVVYIVVILKLAYFSKEPGSRTSVDMKLFGTWGVSAVEHTYIIENILMFIPFGILFPFAF